MHLLLVRSTKSLSGTETYNINLFRELLKDSSIKVNFLTNLNLFAEELKKNSSSIYVEHWLPVEVGTKKQLLVNFFYFLIFIPRYITKIREIEMENRFDVICLQSRTEMIFLTPFLKSMHYKVVWIQHGSFFTSQASSLIKKLYLLTSHLVNKIIVPSKDTRTDLVFNQIKGELVKVIHIGINMKLFHPSKLTVIKRQRRNLELKAGSFIIGFLGTLTAEKGIEDFITVSKRLGKRNYQYIVIGDGSDKTAMKQEIPEGLFTGFVLDVRKYLKVLDILLFPTHHYEATSIAILEAQAMGIPVLAYDKGGTREIITHGYNGFLYKEGDWRGMVRDAEMLNENRKLLREMGRHARQKIEEEFNIEKQGKEFVKFFKSL